MTFPPLTSSLSKQAGISSGITPGCTGWLIYGNLGQVCCFLSTSPPAISFTFYCLKIILLSVFPSNFCIQTYKLCNDYIMIRSYHDKVIE